VQLEEVYFGFAVIKINKSLEGDFFERIEPTPQICSLDVRDDLLDGNKMDFSTSGLFEGHHLMG
jgi:hypothetical protein